MVDATLHGLFHEACDKVANNTCVTCIFEKHQLSVSYNEMKGIVKEFHDQWKLIDICIDDFVGIIADELDVGVIAILIGVLEKGSPFVFIDPTCNDITDVVQRLDVRYFISEGTTVLSERFHSSLYSNLNMANLGLNFKVWKRNTPASTSVRIPGLAFAVFSSGTTGTPKIIKVPHRCIVPNILDLRKIYKLQPTDTVYMSTSPTFDPCILDIFLAFSSGSSILVTSNSIKFDHDHLSKLFSEKVTVLYTTPSLFLKFFPKNSDCKSVRILILGGEPFPNLDIRTWPSLKNVLVYNIYGITEVSCWASISLVVDFKDVSLGEPLTDTVLEIRDDDGLIINEGEGELFIGSERRICVLDDEVNSLESGPCFRATGDVVKVSNKKYYFIGRKDRRIKLFGHLVNLSLIELKTSSYSPVKCCCCIFIHNENKIVLFVELYDNLIIGDLETYLKTELPSYMLPGDIIEVREIPLNKHGKVCQKSCQELYVRLKRQAIHNVPLEFRKLWMKYTTHDSDSRLEEHIGFLQSGGNSMLALQFSEAMKYIRPQKNLIRALLSDKNYNECLQLVMNEETESDDDRMTRTSSEVVSSIDSDARGSALIRNEITDDSRLKKKLKTDSESKLLRVNCKGKITTFSDLKNNYEGIAGVANVNVKWKQDLEKCVDASPTLLVFDDQALVICGSHAGHLFLIDVKSGNVKSRFRLPDRIESSACTLPSGEFIFIGCYDHKLYCLNLKKETVEWSFQTNDMVKSTPVYHENRIYFGSYDHNFYCLSSSDGSLLWKVDIDKSSIYATAVVKKRIIIVATLGGTVAFINHDGSFKHFFSCGNPFFSSPCGLLNDLCLAVDVTGDLHLLNVGSGSQVWQHHVHGNVFSSITTVNYSSQRVIFGCHDKSVYCFEISASQGFLCWRTEVDFPVYSTPFCCRCVGVKANPSTFLVTVATTSGNVYVLNAQDGNIMKSYSINEPVFSSPVVFDSNIIVGCRDNNLYCLEVS